MSGKEPIGNAVDQILQNVDGASLQDVERARECIRLLLNLVEKLNADLRKAQAEIDYLREQLQGRKGGGGDRGSEGTGSGEAGGTTTGTTSRSSEKERKEPRESHESRKQGKRERIRIDREEVLKVDRATLPADAEFKGYEEVVVQDVHLRTDNVKFRKEKYYSASTGKTYLAPLPAGYGGEYGPNVKTFSLLLAHQGNMTEPKIAEVLRNVGVVISSGQISRLLAQGQERLQEEKEAIVEAGLASSPWQQLDDTGTRVDGENQHCHVLCNPLYTAYSTTPRKDRMTVIDVLRNHRERIFRLNEEAYELLRQFKVSSGVIEGVRQLPREQDWTEAQFQQRLSEQLPDLSQGTRDRIREAALIAAYHAETEHPVVRLLVCDDAKQFKRVTEELALCWVHDGRHYQNLEPCVGLHRQLLEGFRKKYWDYYRELRAYQRAPTPERAGELRQQFEALFSTVTGYEALDERIAKSREDEESLLQVLKYPEIPLHNNAAELAARLRVRKRVVSYGPRSERGAKMWDTMETVLGTAKKLGVNFFHYLRDRFSGAPQMPSLAALIREKAKILDLGPSWPNRASPPIY